LLQFHGQQSRYKVVWVRDGQAAIQRVKNEPCLWKEMLETVEAGR
jgi:predicted alpha/beta superfamily hydrolase